ncbi:peptidoglycan DD-metalloendopeptidase family protein [Paraferrimonas sp. SM1919]|uniref:peptidoglycan DD-metalloendopeptidase family protein n=1 Tax=Paraferrimonas sp. SM1919 TaxID=2662263 RepID=UPI0013D77497|nr:peptidoglycan DD-metalloendopeptidase family protein [Paraferrimonas sp. SM1919]
MRKFVTFFSLLPAKHKVSILVIIFAVLAMLQTAYQDRRATQNLVEQLKLGERHQLVIPQDHSQTDPLEQQQQSPQFKSNNYRVEEGDSLARLFDRAGLTPQDLYRVSRLTQAGKKLTKILPGQTIEITLDDKSQFHSLTYQYDKINSLHVGFKNSKLSEWTTTKEIEIRRKFAQASISSNFWNAATDAGLSPNQIMKLAGIFGWDIDFALDIRSGDKFFVLFEQKYVEGEYLENGNILAAEFINQDETFTAIHYKDGEYYNKEGRSMRKAFLRAPVDFTRVSSNFNPRRLHPVTGRVRAHNGVDYAAPIGTPVYAAGAGRVTQAGYSKYNGNYIFIKHPNNYITKYLHLNKRKVRKGKSVKQGDIIGTVGRTGRVTGAHLHYEFIVNGVHRNPRTVKMPKPKPINASEKANFTTIANELMAQINTKKTF